MSSAWDDLVAQGNSVGLQTARWLVEHLLDMEHTDRAMRSIRYHCTVPSSRCTVTWLGLTSTIPRLIRV